MNINITNVELDDNIMQVELDCPQCNNKFITTRTIIKAALTHNQKNIYCSKKCAFASRKVTKEQLKDQIMIFYKINNKVPTHKDFKNNKMFRIHFGNFSNALSFCGLSKPLTQSANRNTWARQKETYTLRKKELVNLKGGKCEICGYCKNYSSLIFHHIDPTLKEMSLDARSLGNVQWERIVNEADKCQLLCHNCHGELHNPHLNID